MEKISILVVDDHKIIRDGVKLMLSKEKEIEIIEELDSGEEALKYVDEHFNDIDVILIDINMPNMDGIEFTKRVTEKYHDIKILALTMHSQENYIENMLKAGALGYILKESGQDELITAVKTVAQGKRYLSNEVSVTMINSLMNKSSSSKDTLSDREQEVLKLIAMGKTSKEAGEELYLSTRTIETHRRNIMSKLGVENTAEMIKYAIKHNIIS